MSGLIRFLREGSGHAKTVHDMSGLIRSSWREGSGHAKNMSGLIRFWREGSSQAKNRQVSIDRQVLERRIRSR